MVRPLGKTLIFALCLGATAGAARADDECRFYTYKAYITAVYDGDTVTADVDLGFHIWVRGEKLRLYGIDAPELRARPGHPLAEGEHDRAIKARDALRDLILNQDVVLCTVKDNKGKYGRYLAKISTVEGLDVNQWLVDQGHAKPYMVEAAALN